MAIIHIPTLPAITPSIAHYALKRGYYYAAGPHHAVIVSLDPEIDMTTLCGKFDCIVGDHGKEDDAGYTASHRNDCTHSKITIKSRVPADATHDLTWSDFLAECPTDARPQLCYQRGALIRRQIELPALAEIALRDRYDMRRINVSAYIWSLIEKDLGES